MAEKKAKKALKDLLRRIHDRFKVMSDADEENRRKALEDLKFVNIPGEQWEEWLRRERGDRPCYEFNKTRVTVKRVVNDMRANRPAGKVRAVEDGDTDTAEIYEGLIRNIWNTSDGDSVIDSAAEFQVACGIGAWRVSTKYASEASFDQDVCVEQIVNPFCLYADPAAKDILHRDAEDWIFTERIAKTAFERKYPNATKVSWEDSEFDDLDEWEDDETVRVCEYWWKEPVEKEIWQLNDGRIVEASSDEATLISPSLVHRRRVVMSHKIMMCIASGDAILEGPTEWAGAHFPFVLVYGERMVIDGKVRWYGLARFMKDPQRSYNSTRTAITETIALAPNFKWWSTATQAEGHVDKWSEAHKKNYPFMLYNADPMAPGRPDSMPGPQVPVALIQEAQLASDELKAVSGIFDASLGAQGNETSGRAITARQRQAEIATFNYQDNLGKGVRRTWEILIDLIPKVYDTERQLRVLGADGAEKYAKINEVKIDPATGQQVTVNDLSRGRYDVAVTVGPSFATQRQEAAEAYTELASRDPNVMMAAGDLVFKALDLPYAQEIAERYRALLPPPIQQMMSEGKPLPPEAMAAMQQANMAMQQVQEQGMLVQQAAQEAQTEKADAEKAKAEVEKVISDLEVKKAQFDAYVAKQLAAIELKGAQAVNDETSQAIKGERDALSTSMTEAVANIQQMAQQFQQQALQTIAEIMTKTPTQVLVQPPPRIKAVVRQNGAMVPVYEDQAVG